MATLREYFDADFEHAAKVHVKLPNLGSDVEAVLLYDFTAFTCFMSCYIYGDHRELGYFIQVLEALQPGKSLLTFDRHITVPSDQTDSLYQGE